MSGTAGCPALVLGGVLVGAAVLGGVTADAPPALRDLSPLLRGGLVAAAWVAYGASVRLEWTGFGDRRTTRERFVGGFGPAQVGLLAGASALAVSRSLAVGGVAAALGALLGGAVWAVDAKLRDQSPAG